MSTVIPVQLGNVTVGKATARVGLKIDRGCLELEAADELFCERRLVGKLIHGGANDAAGQTTFIEEETLAGAFDTKSFSVNAERISAGVTFALAEIDLETLPHFSKGSARLVIEDVTDIPAEVKAARVKEAEETKSLVADGPWRSVNLDELFDPKKGIRKCLAAAEINTVGELAAWSAAGKDLVQIKGIGEGKATEIEDRMEQFWRENPQAAAEEASGDPDLDAEDE